jgi:glyoxylate/hydroxypyruvate reductase A
MNVALALTGAKDTGMWHSALARHLPGVKVHDWQPGTLACDYAVVWAPPAQFFEEQRQLKALFSAGAGVDHIVKVPTLPAQLPVVRIEDAGMAQQMAHYCLWAAARAAYGLDEYAKAQQERRWIEGFAAEKVGASVGVLGLGVLGSQVARALAVTGFETHGYSQSAKQVDGVICWHGNALDQFLAATQILIVIAPRTPQTTGMINAALLAKLKRPAHLVNIARGALVNDADVLAALDTGVLQSATLDVFSKEPLPTEHPYWSHPKVTVTPHMSGKSVIGPAMQQIAQKILQLERGQVVSGLVDRIKGY